MIVDLQILPNFDERSVQALDRETEMSRVYVGNLDPRATERELEDAFRVFGLLRSVWLARKQPGFAFVEFEDRRDALDAVRALNGKHGWRVELSYSSSGGGDKVRGGGGGGGEDLKCYECGEPGHFARECRLRVGARSLGRGGRGRSRSPRRYRLSPSYGRSSPRPHRSVSPRRYRSPNYSPRRRDRRVSPVLNGKPFARERRRSRS